MKIQTLPFENIYSPENLYHAWHKVSLGKSAKSSVLNFYRNLDKNLASIAEDLKNGTYHPGHYNLFLIKDPKERIISASPVRDRIVQHAIMNYYDPVFDRNLIFDSYACRVGKGTHILIHAMFLRVKGYQSGILPASFLQIIIYRHLTIILKNAFTQGGTSGTWTTYWFFRMIKMN